MSSISSVSSSIASSYTGSTTARHQRPDPAKMAEDLFSQLDTSNKGYIEQTDLETALSSLTTSTSGQQTASAGEIFSQLDSNGDGKVTQDEMSSSISALAQALDDQFNQSRMQGGMPPPPPPGGDDAGMSQDEMNTRLSEVGSSDSALSSLLTNIVGNFEAADTNQDGKVSFQEATAYDQAHPTDTSSDSTNTTNNATTASSNTDAKVFRQIMDLLHAYGTGQQNDQASLDAVISSISTSA